MTGETGQTWEYTNQNADGSIHERWQFLIVRSYTKGGKVLHDVLDLHSGHTMVMADASLDIDRTVTLDDGSTQRLTVKRLG